MAKKPSDEKWENHELEEYYFPGEKREIRKERKIASRTDRSKYKKTDAKQLARLSQEKEEELLKEGNFLRGRVLSIFSEGVRVEVGDQYFLCTLRGSLKKTRTKQKRIVAVGDFVQIATLPDQEGVIVHVEERKSVLSRSDSLTSQKEHIIATNIDQVLITVSVVEPFLKPALIDRYIIATESGQMQPVIIINKIDLLTENEEENELYQTFLEAYRSSGYLILSVSAETGEGINALKEVMKDKASVFSGQSGVGKSSLINAVTGLDLSVRKTIKKTKKGSHTTTRAKLIPLEFGGWCIDTPGIRSFGLWNFDVEEVQTYFPDFAPFASNCFYPNCSHIHEPDCAIQQAVEKNKIHPMRYESYCSLIQTLKQENRRI